MATNSRPGHVRIAGGTSLRGPISRNHWLPGQRQEVTGFSFRDTYRTLCHEFYDFYGEVPYYDVEVPVIETDGTNKGLNLTGGTSGVSVAMVRIPRAGKITGVSFGSNSAVTQSGTNYFTVTSNLTASSTTVLSTTAHVNTTDSNAAAINGGQNLVAGTDYPLTLTGTTASLYVQDGDVLTFTVTSTGTGSPTTAPYIRVRVATVPVGLHPVFKRTAGQPQAYINPSTTGGELVLALDGTSEAQTMGVTFGDQLVISDPDVAAPDLTGGPFVEMRVQLNSVAVGANDVVVLGVGTAFNATLSSISKYAWVKLNGNMNLTLEGNDGTTTTTGQAPVAGTTALVASTYYYFTLDFSDPTQVAFWYDDGKNDIFLGTVPMGALAVTDVLQPIIAVQRSSGTDAIGVIVDCVSVRHNRYA
jgi:hypothetical protein